jgi:hypothetical protein
MNSWTTPQATRATSIRTTTFERSRSSLSDSLEEAAMKIIPTLVLAGALCPTSDQRGGI